MNKDQVQGHWHEMKGMIKQKWGKLTDDDVAKMNGTREQLSGALQKRYGDQKEKVEKDIDAFLNEKGWH